MSRTAKGVRGAVVATLAALWTMTTACGGTDGSGSGAAGGGGGSGGSGGGSGSSGGGPGACPGVEPPATGYPVCRSNADCMNFAMCVSGPIGGCGSCFEPEHACVTDADCGSATMVCQPYLETASCLCGSPEGTKCVTRCPDQPCAADAQCSPTGHCDPTPCDQGYACSADRACKPGDPKADVHACAPKLCTEGFKCEADFECAAGDMSADEHGCKAISCSKGFKCSPNQECSPTLGGHGCAQRACAADGDCACGACVMGKCEDRLWICDSPPV